jgi:uncharacterized protein YndB with AHSA1/START domain
VGGKSALAFYFNLRLEVIPSFLERRELPMAKIEVTEFIKRPPQDVFEYLTDPATFPKWQSNAEYAEWTSAGMPGVGSTYKVVSKFLGSKTEAVLEVTIWDPPNRFGFKSIDIPFPIKSLAAVTTFAPKENGTQLTLEGQVATLGIFKLLESFLAKQAKKQDASNINTMKQLLEAD